MSQNITLDYLLIILFKQLVNMTELLFHIIFNESIYKNE